MKRVACYIRVSTLEQNEHGYSMGEQKEKLTAYCKAKDWDIYDVYEDGGYSGASLNRPALQRLFHDGQQKRFDAVLVYKLDRLSRSQKDTLTIIEDKLLNNNVEFVSMNENFDTSTPFGRAMIGILSVFAQLEREQIAERMEMGRIGRAKAGLYHGGGPAPIGYDYTDGHLVINEYEAMQIKLIFDMFLNGKSVHSIHKHLQKNYSVKSGNWTSITSVRRTLKQILYAGKIERGGNVYDGQHEAIISMDIFEKTQQRLDRIREMPKNKRLSDNGGKARSLLTGLLFCNHCGARYFNHQAVYVYKEKREPRYWYKCYSRHGSPAHMVKDKKCKNKNFRQNELETHIINEMTRLAVDESYFKEIKENNGTKIDTQVFEKRIKDIDSQLSRLVDLYQLGSIPFEKVKNRTELLSNEKETLMEKMNVKESVLSETDAKRELGNINRVFEKGTLEEKRELLFLFIDKITIDDKNVSIHWNFA